MNRDWRIGTARGVFALKRIVDVPLPLARRNLALLTALASDGIPACPPLPGTGGDPVLEVGDRGYCLFPWLEGTHPRGLGLTLAQAGALDARGLPASQRDLEGGTVVGVVDRVRVRVRVRPFGEEVARSATLLFGRDEGPLDLDRVSAFVGGYRGVLPLSGEDLRDAVERLWWNRMCGYWHLEFHYDRRDHSCDHLFPPAALLLEWWTGRRDEVRRAFDAG